jgi:cytochrome P450
VAGYELPAGAQVMCSQLVIQRDPRFWRDPEKFVPERWLDSAIDALPRFAYFPFGGGPRICVGNHFALLEIAIALAIFTDRLDWSMLPDAEIELELLVTLRIAKPIRAAFVDRRA